MYKLDQSSSIPTSESNLPLDQRTRTQFALH